MDLDYKTYEDTVKLSPNVGKGGDKSHLIDPKFIVLHHSSGSFAGTVDWILRKESQVSYHYVIDPDTGDRVQMVWDSRRAWHAGKSAYDGYSGLNDYSVGISFAGDTYKRNVNSFEIDSCAKKCIYLMNKFRIPLKGIITHQMCASTRKNDCSPETYDRVIERIKELLF